MLAQRRKTTRRQSRIAFPPSAAKPGRPPGAPTGTHEESYRIASEELGAELEKLKTLVEVDLKKFEKEMDAAGVAHTPGRIPELK